MNWLNCLNYGKGRGGVYWGTNYSEMGKSNWKYTEQLCCCLMFEMIFIFRLNSSLLNGLMEMSSGSYGYSGSKWYEIHQMENVHWLIVNNWGTKKVYVFIYSYLAWWWIFDVITLNIMFNLNIYGILCCRVVSV